MKYIVRLEPGVWLAPWKGDPGRTKHLDMARAYASKQTAKGALTRARKYRPFKNATIRARLDERFTNGVG